MNQENKRKSKQYGMDESKLQAIKRLKEARNGGKRLDQAIQVYRIKII